MSSSPRPTDPEDASLQVPGGVHSPVELPVEPDLGPVPPLARPEEPGTVQPAL